MFSSCHKTRSLCPKDAWLFHYFINMDLKSDFTDLSKSSHCQNFFPNSYVLAYMKTLKTNKTTVHNTLFCFSVRKHCLMSEK